MPSHLEHPCRLWDKHNIAIAAGYFSVGFAQAFINTPLNIYMVETLNAEPAMQNTISILSSLPWSFKLIFGFISDAFPILNHHRKPYLIIGIIIYSSAFISYAITLQNSSLYLALCIFIGTVGLILLDVMCDTMCVERSRFENIKSQGQMQASCYSIRFGGNLIGSFFGACLCNKDKWGFGLSFHEVAFYNGFIPLILIMPFIYHLREKYHRSSVTSSIVKDNTNDLETSSLLSNASNSNSNNEIDNKQDPFQQKKMYKAMSFYDSMNIEIEEEGDDNDINELDTTQKIAVQLNEIWQTVQLKAVWKPMAFVYLYNIMQIPNIAWQSYLQLCLHFEPWILGLMVSVGSCMTFLGILAYKLIFFRASWKNIYIYSTLFTTVFSLFQLVLIFQLNRSIGVSNYLFSLGDDVISAYISGIQFLPVCIMYMRLCPEGSEGASYAMLTTFSNVALICASSIGNKISGIWDVSNESMRVCNVNGLWKLSLLTSILSMCPLAMVQLLPADAEQQEELSKSKEQSQYGGIIFLIVLGTSLSWAIYSALYEILIAWSS